MSAWHSNSRFYIPILAISIFAIVSPASAAVVVDGRVDEPEWEQATRYSDFKITEPFRLTSPEVGAATEARMLSTEDGIVVAFKLEQAPGMQRVKPRLERDNDDIVDSVNFIVDFDGDGNAGYSFTVGMSGSILDGVVSNENVVSYDWDTDWTWAVSESDGGWQVEMLIPWTVAPMRGTDTPTRKMKIYFSRQFGSTRERLAFPATAIERGKFLSEFEGVEIQQYRKALFHYWPYATVVNDMITGKAKYKAGVDVFWKPSPNFQLSATVNPDFGQVEADDIVVNFDAIEVFFSDRRPFFTENQSLFDVRTADSSRLINTRRIGAASDDGAGTSDIDAALKINGSVGGVNYGVMAATENGDAGRDFYAARLLYPVNDRINIGWLGTYVDRPLRDRTAQVQQFDMSWRPSRTLLVNAQWLGTYIDQAGNSIDDTGFWLRTNWTPSDAWSYRFEATHFGEYLNFNDFGFMRRNSLNEIKGVVGYTHRVKSEESKLSSVRWLLQMQARENDAGDHLQDSIILVNNYTFRGGNKISANITHFTQGWDDLISRGNGLWKRSARNRSEISFDSRRYGDFDFGVGLTMSASGLSAKNGHELEISSNWYPSDAFNTAFRFGTERTSDWLIWEGVRDFGRYERRRNYMRLDLSWFPGLKHEFRLKSEWVSNRASEGHAYRLNDTGEILPTGTVRPDFDINNFGLQLRYRYLLGPQSDFYIAYSRGGEIRQNREDPGFGDLFDEALDLRDSDQLLLKARYRF
jgi:Domain of unknown function (DUF5916)